MLERFKAWLKARNEIQLEVGKKEHWDSYNSDKDKYYYKYKGIILWSHKYYKWVSQMSRCTSVKKYTSLTKFLKEEEKLSFYTQVERKNIVRAEQILGKVSDRIFLDEKMQYKVQECLLENAINWAKEIEALTHWYNEDVEFFLKEANKTLPIIKY